MSGFKAFVLKGNLVDLAVAVIIGTAFGAVVTAFTAWLTGLVGGSESMFKDAILGDLAFFINAAISFLVLAAVVYFFVVVPYIKAKEKFFPDAAEGDTPDIALLTEIRDLLAKS